MRLTSPDPAAIRRLLCGMPKAELHVHIEGTLEPELAFTMARRNGIQLPYATADELRAAYSFTNLQSFLDVYYAGASVLLQEEDFFDLAMAYLRRAATENVLRAEIFFDPQTHTARGVAFEAVVRGLSRACRVAGGELGISAALIMCFLRHLPEEDAFATLEQALPWRDAIIGVGLDSSEVGHPPEKFARVFAECGKLGWHRVAHAGEEGPPAYIWGALRDLGAERIDHGVQALKDPQLVAFLASERIPLTVCPLSNDKLRVFQNLRDHNLPQLMAAGLCATINSDDPAYFGGYLNANFTRTFDELGLGYAEAKALALNSFAASFLPATDKAACAQKVRDYFDAFCGG